MSVFEHFTNLCRYASDSDTSNFSDFEISGMLNNLKAHSGMEETCKAKHRELSHRKISGREAEG